MPPVAQQRRAASRRSDQSELKVSAYDQVASMLVALLIVIGFFVVLLFLLWLTTRAYARQKAVPVEVLDDFSGTETALGSAEDLEPPGVEELPDVTEPQLNDMITAVTDAISTQSTTLEAMEGQSRHVGKGAGRRDGRAKGPDGGRPEPPVRRINYITTSLDAYASQLDFFEIELGLLRPGGQTIQYASHLTKSKPDTRVGSTNDEDRSYFLWSGDEPMIDLDKALLRKAGISTGNGIVIQFWPDESWRELLNAEALHAEGSKRKVTAIRRTDFGVKPVKGGFDIFVFDQRYRFGR